MNALYSSTVAAFLLAITMAGRAQVSDPALYVPVAISPEMEAFTAWHAALVSDDFDTFQKHTFWVDGITDDLRREMFAELRKMTPALVKVTKPSRNKNGSITFYAVGCKNNVRLGSLVTMGNETSRWLIAPSLWSLPWNEIAKKCPV